MTAEAKVRDAERAAAAARAAAAEQATKERELATAVTEGAHLAKAQLIGLNGDARYTPAHGTLPVTHHGHGALSVPPYAHLRDECSRLSCEQHPAAPRRARGAAQEERTHVGGGQEPR